MPRPRSGPTRKPPYDSDAAVAALSAADPKLARLIERAGPFTVRLASQQSPFEALAESIIYQQLHGKAAATIHARMLASFGPLCGIGNHPSPQHLLNCPNEQLRAAGLSKNKMLALRDLSAKTLDGTVPTLAAIKKMPDEDIIEHITQVRGIGRWTVEILSSSGSAAPTSFQSPTTACAKALRSPISASSRQQKLLPTSFLRPNRWSGAERSGRRGALSRAGTCGVRATSPPAKSSSQNDGRRPEHAATNPPPPHMPRVHVAAHSVRHGMSLRSDRPAPAHREIRRLLPLGDDGLLVHRLLPRAPKTSRAWPHSTRRHHSHRIPQTSSVPSTRNHPRHIFRQSHTGPLLLLHRYRRVLVRSSLGRVDGSHRDSRLCCVQGIRS